MIQRGCRRRSAIRDDDISASVGADFAAGGGDGWAVGFRRFVTAIVERWFLQHAPQDVDGGAGN